MNTNKFLIGGIIGGIAYFLIGWLVWGILLRDFMAANVGSAGNVMKSDSEMIWWALIVGNIFSGLTLSYVLNKANAMSAGAGAMVGGVLGLLMAAAFDFTMFGVSNLSTLTGTFVDIVANTAVSAIVGGIVGWFLSRK